MVAIGAINAFGLLASLVGLGILCKRHGNHPARWLVTGLLIWTTLHSLGNTLEWTGLTSVMDPYEDYLQIISPALWTGFFYMFIVESEMARRKASEERLRESEERLSSAVDGARIGLWDWRVQTGELVINRQWANMLGYSREELAPVSIKTWATLCHPDDLAVSNHLLEEHFARKTPYYEFETRLRHKNGQWTWVLDRGRVMTRDASDRPVRMAGTHVDITPHKLAEEALRASEEKLSQLFQLSPDAIAVVRLEAHGQVLDVNQAFVELFGYEKDEIVGRGDTAIDLFDDPSACLNLFETLTRETTVLNREILIRRKNGETTPCSLSCQLLPLGGRPCMLAVFRNISESKKMQEMMVQTEKMLSVGGIAAGIAHEINNPLGIVLQAAQNLAQRARPDFPRNIQAAEAIGLDMALLTEYMRARKLDVFIQDIQTAALRAAEIIRHMLDFSRRSESTRNACELPVIAHKALTLAQSDYDLKKSYDFKKITISIKAEDDLPDVLCTETEIEQVFLNLLRNAAQAMASATPAIENPRIDIRLSATPASVHIEVEDNGPGMPPELQRRIFEPFFTTKAPGVGTGLGLSVSYFIITKGHGGKMAVDSQPGKGARFTIDLPRKEIQT